MKKKILIVSLLLLAGTAVAVFAAIRCTSEWKDSRSYYSEWVRCEKNAGHSLPHQGRDSKGNLCSWYNNN
jgi:hypothetical protein